MSIIVPDYDYVPATDMFASEEVKKERIPVSEQHINKDELVYALKNFADGITDLSLYRFYANALLASKTSTNVFDSIGFFTKFSRGFLASIKINFPDISPSDIEKLEKSLKETEKIVDSLLRSGNVENKFLLALVLGMVEGMLHYENY